MTPRTRTAWTATQISRIKPLIFVLCLYPVFRWFGLGLSAGLGAHPQQYLILSSGLWALIALTLTLAITPLRQIFHQPALIRLRRMLGLFSFFYTVLHIIGWALWERNGSLYSMWQDVIDRPFITIGAVATLPFVALAITSTRGWMRRLGQYWQKLHRSIYIIAILSVWHFWLVRSGKNDYFDPYMYGTFLAILLFFRLIYWYRKNMRQT